MFNADIKGGCPGRAHMESPRENSLVSSRLAVDLSLHLHRRQSCSPIQDVHLGPWPHTVLTKYGSYLLISSTSFALSFRNRPTEEGKSRIWPSSVPGTLLPLESAVISSVRERGRVFEAQVPVEPSNSTFYPPVAFFGLIPSSSSFPSISPLCSGTLFPTRTS